jgi:hypothetical protein
MAKQYLSSIKIDLPSSSVVSGTASLAKTAQNHLQAQRSPNRREQQIGSKTREQLAKQIGYAMKTEHAGHLVNIIDQRTLERWSDYLDFDRSLRNKPRDPVDQADIEYLFQMLREAHATSLMTIRKQGIEQIELIVSESLEPEEEQKPHYLVEYDPGILGRIFGGQRLTKVMYDVYDGD